VHAEISESTGPSVSRWTSPIRPLPFLSRLSDAENDLLKINAV